MTYNVFGGTLNLPVSVYHDFSQFLPPERNMLMFPKSLLSVH